MAGKTDSLLQTHFHAPSEYTYPGKPFPMEVYFVHQERGGSPQAVIGVFMGMGGDNETSAAIMNPAPHPAVSPVTMMLDPADLLPQSTSYGGRGVRRNSGGCFPWMPALRSR